MVLVYATTADYTAWTGTTAPTNIVGLLRTASLQVGEATELSYYAVDITGAPTDPIQKQAFNDATCSQAAALNALKVDPNAGGAVLTGVASQKSIGTAHVVYADAIQAAAAKTNALTGLVPEAQRILARAKLAPTAPWVAG